MTANMEFFCKNFFYNDWSEERSGGEVRGEVKGEVRGEVRGGMRGCVIHIVYVLVFVMFLAGFWQVSGRFLASFW